jgi:hypothetical protein
MKAKALTWAGLGLALLAAGCYSFRGSSLPVGTVGIPVATNTSKEFRATDAVTRALFDAVSRDGRLKVAEAGQAQSLLAVEVTDYRREPFIYTSREQVTQYKVTLTARASFKTSAEKVLWKSDAVSGWGTYAPDSLDESKGIERAAAQLAQEVVRQAFETW